jgi:hypothetical protein
VYFLAPLKMTVAEIDFWAWYREASVVLPESGNPHMSTSSGGDLCFMAFSLLGSDVSVEPNLDEQLRGQRRRSAVVDETPIAVVADRDGQ